jgi:hypothetical protein
MGFHDEARNEHLGRPWPGCERFGGPDLSWPELIWRFFLTWSSKMIAPGKSGERVSNRRNQIVKIPLCHIEFAPIRRARNVNELNLAPLSPHFPDDFIARVSQQADHVGQARPIEILGQSQAFVDVFFQTGQASAAGKSRGCSCFIEMRRNPRTSPFSLHFAEHAFNVGQIGFDFAGDGFAGMIGMESLQDQLIGALPVQPLGVFTNDSLEIAAYALFSAASSFLHHD